MCLISIGFAILAAPVIISIIVAIVSFFEERQTHHKHKKIWAKQVLIAYDQLLNALGRGWADETFSSRAYRLDLQGRRWATLAKSIVDVLFFCDQNHCRKSFERERSFKRLLPELRRD